MSVAHDDDAAKERLERAQERLNAIWSEWGMTLDQTMSTAQMNALGMTVAWLDKGAEEPWRIVRAVQYLLCSPEIPGVNKRACWAPLKKALLGAWGNVATQTGDVQLLQALLLAGWSEGASGIPVARLLAPAWSVQRGRESQRRALQSWLETQKQEELSIDSKEASGTLEYHGVEVPDIDARLAAITLHYSSLEMLLSQGQSSQHWRPQLMSILTTMRDALLSLKDMGDQASDSRGENAELIEQAIAKARGSGTPTAAHNLLWWGQSRYSHALRKSYRLFDHTEDVTFWAPFEAAKLAHHANAELEPAASYVVEVLRALDRDVQEQKSLGAWLEILHRTLQRTADKVPPLSTGLAKLANEDALGMPVTWVRLRAAEKSGLEGAGDAVALPLDEPIDRGQWAAWIFRETLLDLHFSQGKQA